MNKKKLLDLIAKKEARKTELNTKAAKSESVEELRSINAEMETLNNDITELRSLADSIPDDTPPATPPTIPPVAGPNVLQPEGRGAAPQPQGPFNPLGTYGIQTPPAAGEKRGLDAVLAMPVTTPEERTEMRQALFALPEYRTGYLKALQGKPAASLTDTEKRALTTAVGSGGAAVPTTTYDMIIKRLQQTSVLFPLIQKTYIPGNIVLPVADPQKSADWTDTIDSSTLLGGNSKDDTVGSVSLGSYGLSKFAAIKGQLLLMAIDAFESYIVGAISDQLAIAIENAILNGAGAGSNQPTGIFVGVTFGDTNSRTYAATGLQYDDLVDTKKLLKSMYRPKAMWIMNSNMEAEVQKIKTTTGKPIFSQDPQNGFVPRILNFPYVVDDYMPDEKVLFARPDYYFMNFNQNPVILSDDSAGFLATARLYRGTLFADGKPALDEAFVKLSKAAA